METAARQQFKDDPKTLDATIRYLRERKSGVDAARKDREEQTAGTVWVAASQGQSLAQITKMPDALRLSGKEQVADQRLRRPQGGTCRRRAAPGRGLRRGAGRAGVPGRGAGGPDRASRAGRARADDVGAVLGHRRSEGAELRQRDATQSHARGDGRRPHQPPDRGEAHASTIPRRSRTRASTTI